MISGSTHRSLPFLSALTRSLVSRTVMPLALVLAAITAFTAIGIAHKDNAAAREALKTKTALLAAIAGRGIATSVWNMDSAQTQASLAALSDDPDYVGSAVFDPDGRVFASHGASATDTGELIVRRVPIVQIDQGSRITVGTLVLRMSTARSDAEIAHQTMLTLLLGLAALIVVCGIVVAIVRGTTRPIVEMTLATKALAQGDVDIDIGALDRLDEIGDMARALLVLRAHEQERGRLYELQSQHLEIIEREVEKRTAELQEALDRLNRTKDELVNSEKLAALGGMVAGIAHEVNTPIGGVLMVATTLNDRLMEFDTEMSKGAMRKSAVVELTRGMSEGLGIILKGITRAANLIRSFKQVAVDRTSDRRLDFQLAELLTDITATLSIRFRPRVAIEVEAEPGLVLDSYPGSLGQVVTNLVENAFVHGFADERSGTIKLSARSLPKHQYELIVEDDGVGVPPEHLKRIFEPFFTTRLGQGGSGLGLHIAYTIVTTVHGGSIQVTSAHCPSSGLKAGTRFRIVAPRMAPERQLAPDEVPLSLMNAP
ncbi:MAG TPA: ATP-binding protein [Stellaceae bacterium]|nr:ATP-binding protein [Stellaceae bacterium]